MPEGHTVHRIALQFDADFVGHVVAASSPQGRFAAGAALLDGRRMTAARAVGKHLLLGFGPAGGAGTGTGGRRAVRAAGLDPEPEQWLRVHLGLYGAWDFHGRISPITTQSAAVGSMGAPRLRRAVRMGEGERGLPTAVGTVPDDAPPPFPPEPVGQVRVRLMTAGSLADLRGPTACEVLTPEDVAALLAKAGPDPRVDAGAEAEASAVRRLTSRRTPVGQLLMDQSVISGIGNIYRAEMLFRARLDPHTPGTRVPTEVARGLWRDWVELLDDGVRTGVMVTREDLDAAGRARAVADPALRHAVYGRAGEPCLVCGAPIVREEMAGRSLFWCPTCQV